MDIYKSANFVTALVECKSHEKFKAILTVSSASALLFEPILKLSKITKRSLWASSSCLQLLAAYEINFVFLNVLNFKKERFPYVLLNKDHLCGLVVRVPGYRSRGPGSILGATRISEK
jgi:hypothetical protein